MTPGDDLSAVAKALCSALHELCVDPLGFNETWALEQIEAAIRVQREAGRQERDVWDVGLADDLSSLLNEFIRWARCDRHENGPGPAGGFDIRIEDTERARKLLGVVLLRNEELDARVVALSRALQQLIEKLQGYAQTSQEHGDYKARMGQRQSAHGRHCEAATLRVCIAELETIRGTCGFGEALQEPDEVSRMGSPESHQDQQATASGSHTTRED